MENFEGKHFSITDPQNVRTVVYEVSKTIQRLDSTEEYVGEKIRKTFYIDKPKPEGNRLAIFSFGKDKVVINNGVLDGDKVIIEKAPLPFNVKKH